MSREFDRLLLGTAQFGLPYGRLRATGTLPERVVHEILEAAWGIGIRAFDTSEAYGVSAKRLARWLNATKHMTDASVVTKLPTTDITDRQAVQHATMRFAGARNIVVLSHGATDGESWLTFQHDVRELGFQAGQSVYSAEEVSQAADLGAERVQAPGNVLDLRQLNAAHAARIPADLRSIYLQGVLLEPPDVADRRAHGAGSIAAAVQGAAARVGNAASVLLLATMLLKTRKEDRVLVGVDDVAQLGDVRQAVDLPPNRISEFVSLLDEIRHAALATPNVLDPRTWS